jgi:hypothetical protein
MEKSPALSGVFLFKSPSAFMSLISFRIIDVWYDKKIDSTRITLLRV